MTNDRSVRFSLTFPIPRLTPKGQVRWIGSPEGWFGVQASTQAEVDARVPALLHQPAVVRYLVLNPLVEAVGLRLRKQPAPVCRDCADAKVRGICDHDGLRCSSLEWVIVAGETGKSARPLSPVWARSVRDQCVAAGVPFFFAGWGEWGIGGANAVQFGDDGTFCPTRGNICTRPDWNHLHTLMSRRGPRAAGRLLDGRTWDEMPAAAKSI